MLGRLLAYSISLAGTQALPQSFVLDMGRIDGAVLDSPPGPLFNTTTRAFGWPTTLQTASTSRITSLPVQSLAANSFIIANVSSTRTCLTTTTVMITLPNPTLRPTSTFERDDDQGALTDGEPDATPFDTATAKPFSKWPHWFTAATFTLVCYDILTLGLLLWLWVFGYLWWFHGRSDGNESAWRRRGGLSGMEMSRIGMAERYDGRYEREWDMVSL
ncbi:uncharacterized protein M421DRAFT_2331 [Didymella exigua CBS 183.55]|uniref:Uncharacterized protein n=1 Tax=Didymella exigua CBS 183.55 TaxID=1150837 RepID=A0A6A5RWJ7_9PLEO|nr:uncharacterized protein M421DRAFT_2331 [Didymella exigua CBS 183.55]KAF1931690.1 hypothetical protein M421DRAFT_2331 [Didymella exigua CBS 183.55]